jgi:heptosyltransferase-2
MSVLDSPDTAFKPAIFLSDKEAIDPLCETKFPLPEAAAIIDPGSAYGPAKEWQKEKYADVIDYLGIERRVPVILLGSERAIRVADEIFALARHKPSQLTGKLTLRQAMVLISRSRLYISPDTGGMHIAAAFGMPQIAIFGSSSPVWTSPLNTKSRILYKDLECSPCFKRKCPLNTYRCLKEISARDVKDQIEKVL